MYFTVDDDYLNFTVFVLMLNLLVLYNNKQVTNWFTTGVSFKKRKPFDANLALTVTNIANDKVSLKLYNSILMQENSPS